MAMNKQFPQVNALDWATVKPSFDALLTIELNAQTVDGWLQQWSDLEAVLEEAGAQIYREITENTADAAAEERFNLYVEEILPSVKIAVQALKQKLLAVEAISRQRRPHCCCAGSARKPGSSATTTCLSKAN